MAYQLDVPCVEGLIRNRYTGPHLHRRLRQPQAEGAKAKYTPLREVLEGKRVLLVEDSIVRSHHHESPAGPHSRRGPGPRDSRPRGLPADHRPLLLRHRHVDDRRAVRSPVLGPRTADRRRPGENGRATGRRFAAATCRWSRSPGRSGSTPISSARPALPAITRRPAARSCIRSPCRTLAATSRSGPTRRRWASCRADRSGAERPENRRLQAAPGVACRPRPGALPTLPRNAVEGVPGAILSSRWTAGRFLFASREFAAAFCIFCARRISRYNGAALPYAAAAAARYSGPP